MKNQKIIGLTYDLKKDYMVEGYTEEEAAEFDSEETIEGLEKAIHNCGYQTERIGHFKNLVNEIAKGKRWDLVFNICEGMYGMGREAQVPALLDAYKIPYTFSDPLTLSLTLHKGYTKQVIKDFGIPTAPFLIMNDVADLSKLNLQFPLFIKPVAEGTGKGISQKSLIEKPEELKKRAEAMLIQFNQPVLIEEYLPGREFTVGVVGNGTDAKMVGIMEVVYTTKENQIYSYETKTHYEKYVTYRVPEEAICKQCEKSALEIWKVLACRDGGRIDFRNDRNGIPNFIEINPLAGLNYIHSDLPILAKFHGISFDQLIEMILEAAWGRI